MKIEHMHFVILDGHTTFRHKRGGGSNPAKNLQDHLNNISYIFNRFCPNSIEIVLDNEEFSAKVVKN